MSKQAHPVQIPGKNLRRSVQGLFLVLFCALLGGAEQGGLFGLPADLFLRLDPLLGVTIPIAARTFIMTLLPAWLILICAALVGRVFCGWICPMGTTLDIGGMGGSILRFVTRKRGTAQARHDPLPRASKYLLLIAVLVAAVLGVNMVFWFSPLALVTRLYALVLHPMALFGADGLLTGAESLLAQTGVDSMQYAYPNMRSYSTASFVAAFWLGLMVLEGVRPRFWCRYLCPAGALLGLAARLAFWKRHTTSRCNACGRCTGTCATGILHHGTHNTDNAEYLTCMACETACTKKAVRFGWHAPAPRTLASLYFSPSRRALLGSVAAGAVLSAVPVLDASGSQLVRPPGSVPEADFLARCVRCGECMKACPSGGLQATWLQAGCSGLFSPFLDPRSGPCAPDCTACGAVCPSQAITALPLHEKRWAKIGTAVVDQRRCLAWAEDRRCMVCQETCPYGAVSVVPKIDHIAPVPVVHPERCYGCGYCERHCPTSTSSILVEAAGALRLHSSLYAQSAKAAGLELDPAQRQPAIPAFNPDSGGAPPGFLE